MFEQFDVHLRELLENLGLPGNQLALLHYAVDGQTAGEVIVDRADHS